MYAPQTKGQAKYDGPSTSRKSGISLYASNFALLHEDVYSESDSDGSAATVTLGVIQDTKRIKEIVRIKPRKAEIHESVLGLDAIAEARRHCCEQCRCSNKMAMEDCQKCQLIFRRQHMLRFLRDTRIELENMIQKNRTWEPLTDQHQLTDLDLSTQVSLESQKRHKPNDKTFKLNTMKPKKLLVKVVPNFKPHNNVLDKDHYEEFMQIATDYCGQMGGLDAWSNWFEMNKMVFEIKYCSERILQIQKTLRYCIVLLLCAAILCTNLEIGFLIYNTIKTFQNTN